MNRVSGKTGSLEVLAGLLSCLAVYAALQISGFFAVRPEDPVWVLYSTPFLAGAGMVALVLAFRMRGLHSRGASGWLLLFGQGLVVLAIAGLFWGRASRFEGRIILTEGQIFSGLPEEYLPDTVRAGRWAVPPRFELTVTEALPTFAEGGRTLSALGANAQMVFPEERRILGPLSLSSRPLYLNGNWVWLGAFGYSPYYRLTDAKEKVLDESFVYLRLFPPGSEDSFRLLTPHTFYVRYDPRVTSAGDGEVAASTDPGRYHLRITRNKLMLADTDLSPGESVDFDNAAMTLESPRRWVEVFVVHDPGMLLSAGSILAGLVLMGLSRLFPLRGTDRSRQGP